MGDRGPGELAIRTAMSRLGLGEVTRDDSSARFGWNPEGRLQRLTSEPTYGRDLIASERVTLTTELGASLEHHAEAVQTRTFPPPLLAGIVEDPHRAGRLLLASSLLVKPADAAAVAELLPWLMALQLSEARRREALLPSPPESSTNGSGRSGGDPLARYVDRIAIEGIQSGRWTDADLARCFEALPEGVRATGELFWEALALELPFAGETSLVEVDAAHRHPLVGRGLLVRLSLPAQPDAAEAWRLPLQLNLEEMDEPTGADFIGSWTATADSLVHELFVPNAAYQASLVDRLVLTAIARGRWAAEVLAEDDWSDKYDRSGMPLFRTASGEMPAPEAIRRRNPAADPPAGGSI